MTRHVGTSPLRAEDNAFLRGDAIYVEDLRHGLLDGAAYVSFVRSTIGHGHLVEIDVAAARSLPGVHAVVTAADHDVIPVSAHNPDFDPIFAQPLLAERKVRYVGEPIVAIVAESRAIAADAAELVVIDYEPLPAVTTLGPTRAADQPLFTIDDMARSRTARPAGLALHRPNRVNKIICAHDESLFSACDVQVVLRVENPRQSPAPIEPRSDACAWVDGDLYVWSATQVPHSYKKNLCELYNIEPSRVHVVAGPAVGGGFGGKTSRSPEERLLPLLSQVAGRPVRWTETRSEYMAAATQSRGELIGIKIAGRRDGRIEALRVDMVKDSGAYPGVGPQLPGPYSKPMANGAYDIDHVEFGSESVVTNGVQVGAFRGAGRAPLIDALERGVDRFAAEIRMDPAEVRRINLIRPEQMPYATPGGGVYDEADYPADLERALALVGYEDRRAEQSTRRSSGATRQLGIGMACYLHLTGGSGGEEARVTVNSDGTATVVTGSTSQGHGHVTTWAQVAADVLGIEPGDIEVIEGVTDLIATGAGAVGSRSAQTAGIAIHNASEALVEQGCEIAAELLEAARADVVFDPVGSRFAVQGTPAVSVGWAEVAVRRAVDGDEMTCGDVFDPGTGVVPSGTHIAVVEVDTETGAVELIRFVGVDDAGTRINPTIVEGQLHGGIAVGIAQALGEAIVYDDDGNLLTSNFMDYLVAPIDWFPSFELEASSVPTSLNLLGIKAVGESGPIGATAAVHNAIVDAVSHLGVDHIDIPCTPQRIWEALNTNG